MASARSRGQAPSHDGHFSGEPNTEDDLFRNGQQAAAAEANRAVFEKVERENAAGLAKRAGAAAKRQAEERRCTAISTAENADDLSVCVQAC